MPVNEASSEETPYGRYITSDGWFVLNIADALAVRNDEKGGATYPLEVAGVPVSRCRCQSCGPLAGRTERALPRRRRAGRVSRALG